MTANPALALLYVSGLILFWLMPLIAWLLLKGQRDAGAKYWFSGTASYAVVALLFVLQGADSSLVYSGATSGFSMLMVLLLIESMQYELSGRAPRWQRSVPLATAHAVLMIVITYGFGVEVMRSAHLVVISGVDVFLLVLLIQVARQHRSRALLTVVVMLVVVILTNLLRVYRYWVFDETGSLKAFTAVTMVSFLANYLSVVFYSFGYWGFVIEKGRASLLKALEEATVARTGESLALDRERQTQALLRERDELIARLTAMQRIAHFGALTASVAHEINQPLASSKLSAEEALARIQSAAPDAPIEPLLHRIVAENDRAATIVRTLRTMFSGGRTSSDGRTLDQIVRHIVELQEKRARDSGCSIRVDLAAPEAIPAGSSELEHVILNLVSNALDAVIASGRSPGIITLATWLESEQAVLMVCDNGPGVPAAMQPVLFDLMSSQKTDGLGLGLWLSRYIVERHGGRIAYLPPDAASALPRASGAGACFMVKLPRRHG